MAFTGYYININTKLSKSFTFPFVQPKFNENPNFDFTNYRYTFFETTIE